MWWCRVMVHRLMVPCGGTVWFRRVVVPCYGTPFDARRGGWVGGWVHSDGDEWWRGAEDAAETNCLCPGWVGCTLGCAAAGLAWGGLAWGGLAWGGLAWPGFEARF